MMGGMLSANLISNNVVSNYIMGRCQYLPRLCSGYEARILDVCDIQKHTYLELTQRDDRYEGPSEGYVATITEPTRQGGIVSIYYFGTLLGCLMGGILGDR